MSLWSDVADLIDPQPLSKADVFAALNYVPSPKQWRFHNSPEWDVLYGGAAGGGKTKAMVMEGIWACAAHPGLRAGFFRRTFPELARELLPELRKVNYAEGLGATWNKTAMEMTFPNGSVFSAGYLDTLDDATKYQSSEFQLLLLAERTLFVPGVVDMLIERLRSGDARLPVLGVRAGSNPGGPSHAEVKSRYIDPTAYGAHSAVDDKGRTVAFIPATVDDNSHIDPGYRATLEAIPDPRRRAAMLDGSWDVFPNQVFEQWNHDRHVIQPVPLSASWERYVGIDYGLAAPWAVLWGAKDNDGRIWVYREIYETQVGETEQARRILAAEKEGRSIGPEGGWMPEPTPARYIDPATANRMTEAPSIMQKYNMAGCQVLPATNDRLSGWARVHEYLADLPACDLHRGMGQATCPALHVFSTCENLIRTVPYLPRDKNRPEDVDTKAEDHAADALRYLLMAVGARATVYFPDPARNADPSASHPVAVPLGDAYVDPALLRGGPRRNPGRYFG